MKITYAILAGIVCCGCSSNPSIVTIRTKVFIGTVNNVPIVSHEYVQSHIDYAEELFDNFKFEVVERKQFEIDPIWTIRVTNFDLIAEFKDYKDAMCIFYGIDDKFPYVLGITYPPPAQGIYINYNSYTDKNVLSHEIGHYFGLKHTFEDDGLADTSSTNSIRYNNVMNYHWMPDSFVTPQQKELMYITARKHRSHHIIRSPK